MANVPPGAMGIDRLCTAVVIRAERNICPGARLYRPAVMICECAVFPDARLCRAAVSRTVCGICLVTRP